MAILVIAEHDNKSLKVSTLNAVTAAAQLGSDIHVLVAGADAAAAAEAAAKISGVGKVLALADPPAIELGLDGRDVKLKAGRAAVDDHPQPRSVRFPPGCDAEQAAKCISGHRTPLCKVRIMNYEL